MSKVYAKNQPAGYNNHIRNIAIVGAAGQVGKVLTEALLKTGKFTITALTRADSTNVMPEGVKTAEVNYDDHATLVAGLQGQDALIITMVSTAPAETSFRLVRAAAEARVPWILPNEWGLDHDDESLAEETLIGNKIRSVRKAILDIGVSSYIAFVNSFWYEYSIAVSPYAYGFDLPNKKVTFFNDGKTKINTSSFPQCGKGAAGLLGLKILPEDENDTAPTLSQFKNKSVYVSSFTVSQEDMLESVLRVSGDKREDWQITYQPVKERWEGAMATMKKGFDRPAYVTAMYSRVFFPDAGGNFGATKGLNNKELGLEEEDIDTYTKIALQREQLLPTQ